CGGGCSGSLRGLLVSTAESEGQEEQKAHGRIIDYAPAMLEIGAVVAGKLRIERMIGRGGMGVVAVAHHLHLDQQFAIKVLHDELASETEVVERLMRE